jgi:acyl-coenzyme A synthetase/AMP-(fatty) acid ligase
MDRRTDLALLRARWYEQGFYGHRTLSEEMLLGASTSPDARLIIHSDSRPAESTLGEMADLSRRLASGMRRLGLAAGDVIAVQVPNWLEGVVTYQAAMHLGLTIVPIIHIYGASEVTFILRQSGAKALVVPDRWRSIDFLARMPALGDVATLEHVIVITDDPPPGTVGWSSLLDNDLIEPYRSDPDEVCLLIYTSGTTADPKGVQHTHNTLLAEIRSLQQFLYHDATPVALGAFPAGHIAGVLAVLRMFVFGVTTILLDIWNPVEAAALVDRHQVSNTSGAPIFLRTMLDAASTSGADLTSITNYMVGGASVPPALVAEADGRGVLVYRGYGSSEHPVVSTGTPHDPLPKRAGTDGRLTPGNEVRFVDDDGNDVAAGADGEIAVRGPEQFVGYRDAELDATSFLPGGWFLTGDIGRMDEDGYLTITDRKKDIIIRGGENIASKEVEDILARHPGVVEAAVIGVKDDTFGERVCAYIVARPGFDLSLAGVRQHFVDQQVARQKTPERIELVDDLPRSMSGKVKKFELRARFAEAYGSESTGTATRRVDSGGQRWGYR